MIKVVSEVFVLSFKQTLTKRFLFVYWKRCEIMKCISRLKCFKCATGHIKNDCKRSNIVRPLCSEKRALRLKPNAVTIMKSLI